MERKEYVAPMMEIISMDAQGVICGSTGGGNTEIIDKGDSGTDSPNTDGDGCWSGD